MEEDRNYRNYPVEQWITSLINDRRFYSGSSLRNYLEMMLDEKFKPKKIGYSIKEKNGYRIYVKGEALVTVKIYCGERMIYKCCWALRFV